MNEELIWADTFPELKAYPTKDKRIFQTEWEKHGKGLEATKQKKYFACVVGDSCYGIDVYRQTAVDARKECEEAFFRMKESVDYYEKHQSWPHQDRKKQLN